MKTSLVSLPKEKRFNGFDRSVMAHRQKVLQAVPLEKPANVPCSEVLIPVQRNVRIPTQIYRPESLSSPYPTILYIPGTAFVAKEMAFTQVICTHLAIISRCQVILINHRLAPEDQFPSGLDDAYNMAAFILKVGNQLLGVDKNKVVIMGYSSGGNFAASIAMQGKAQGLPVSRQILISPMMDLSRTLKTFKVFEDQDTTITEEFVEWFLNLYLPDDVKPRNPWLSPLWQQPERLRGLPPTDIIFAEYDRFRSDAEAYYDKLSKIAGNEVNRLMIEKENHSFLWYKLELVKMLGMRVKVALGNATLPTSLSGSQRHRLFFVKPCSTLSRDNNGCSIENSPDEGKNSRKSSGFSARL